MSSTTTDPIADMLSRIRNAVAVRKSDISLPHSNIKEAVAKLLKESGFIDSVTVSKDEVGKTLKISINPPEQNSKITEIVRLSRPGRRHYVGASEIPKVKQGRGIVIVSTSQGMMTGKQAMAKKVGGELICKVY